MYIVLTYNIHTYIRINYTMYLLKYIYKDIYIIIDINFYR